MDVPPILAVKNLSVKFDLHTIISGMSFEVKRDETLAIIGPNGAGKSVLFRALLGLIPFNGEIIWAGDVKIGYVPQKLSVARDIPMTVLEFLKLKEPNEKKILEVLTLVGFHEKAEHIHHDIRVVGTRLGSLSGGETQRILIAYALLGDPNLLLLDEPTAGVDIKGEETFYNLFKKLKKDTDLTILFISHDMEAVKDYADRILEINHHPEEHNFHYPEYHFHHEH